MFVQEFDEAICSFVHVRLHDDMDSGTLSALDDPSGTADEEKDFVLRGIKRDL